MKLNGIRCAIASGTAFAILWVICSAFVLLAPGPMIWIGGHMIHANLEAMRWTLTLGGLVTGLIAWSVLAAVTGWLIAAFYNRLAK